MKYKKKVIATSSSLFVFFLVVYKFWSLKVLIRFTLSGKKGRFEIEFFLFIITGLFNYNSAENTGFFRKRGFLVWKSFVAKALGDKIFYVWRQFPRKNENHGFTTPQKNRSKRIK